MSFDALENWINSVVFVPLIDCQEDAPPMHAASVAPDSPEPLALFSEDGICLADGDWSMDYWDPYDLDTGLREQVAPAEVLVAYVRVSPLESGEVMGTLPALCLEVVGGLPGPAFFAPPAVFILQDHTDASRNAIPDVWDELNAIDQLIFQMEGESGDTILPPPTAVRPLHPASGVPPTRKGDGP
ncbi:unnamed protein product [Timema podura]|uniref:Uncharacterized protein n=1 Tax=Timema podura TaxID=61482 RepID=A0ABN7P257_TIMPD|nr:unnamed protein product [Timema podura]